MHKKAKAICIMVFLAAVLLCACGGIPDSDVDIDSVKGRLKQIDAYKKSVPENREARQDYSTADATFRGFNFGVSKEMVGAMETLALSEQYNDALDYTGSTLYGYDMLLTYWFNKDNQLYSAGYSMQNDQYSDTMNRLIARLRGDYGEPYQTGYYDDTNAAVTFNTEREALQAVDDGNAYYYAAFADDFGTQIELCVQNSDAGYQYWVCYTDYSYNN